MADRSEFILNPEAKQVLILKSSGEALGHSLIEATLRIAERSDVQVTECNSVQEVFDISMRSKNCLVIANCSSDLHSSDLNHLLDLCKKEIQERTTQVLITVGDDFLFLQPRFVRNGAIAVLQHPIRSNVFFSNIERLIDRGTKIFREAPLSIRSDCWMMIEGKARWIPGAKKWVLNVIGPPPSYGEWSRSDSVSESESNWEWIPSGFTDDPFILEEGVWTFQGKKPEFKDGAWLFSGLYPKLSFCIKGTSTYVKFKGETGFLSIAEESEHSKIAAEMVERSFLHQCRLPREGSSAEETPGAHSSEQSTGDSGTGHPVPGYLRRIPSKDGKNQRPDSNTLALHPLAAAFYVSELMIKRDFTTTQILWKFCEHLKQVCGGGQIEFWIANDGDWRCIQHDDLVDMALHQRLINAGLRDSLVSFGGQRAVLIVESGRQVGALVVEAGKADIYTDYELLSFCRLLKGIFSAPVVEEVLDKAESA